MRITIDEAAEIYARFCEAHYGDDAIDIVKARAKELRGLGDIEGEDVWNKVARKIKSKVQLKVQPALAG